jgi:cytochrome c oxidase subunit IV
LQRRDDASSVTTDVSLHTLWNRIALALTLVLLILFVPIALVLKTMKAADALNGRSG